MIVWDVRIGKKTVLRFKSESTAQMIADAINSGELYDDTAVIVDTRGPRRPAPKMRATTRTT